MQDYYGVLDVLIRTELDNEQTVAISIWKNRNAGGRASCAQVRGERDYY